MCWIPRRWRASTRSTAHTAWASIPGTPFPVSHLRKPHKALHLSAPAFRRRYRLAPPPDFRDIPLEEFSPPKHDPPIGPNLLVLRLPLVSSGVPSGGLTGLWLSPTFGNFLAVSTKGAVAEAEAGTGQIVRRMRIVPAGERAEVTCACATKWCLYAGVGAAVHELDLATGERRRTLVGLRAAATCVAALSDGRLLAAGAMDCTTFIWELNTGRVFRHVIDCTMSLPDTIKHLADSFLPKSQVTDISHRFNHTAVPLKGRRQTWSQMMNPSQ